MRTHDGILKTVPCKLENAQIEVNGKRHHLYNLKELSGFKFFYYSIPIIIIPPCIYLSFLSVLAIASTEDYALLISYYVLLMLGPIIAVSLSIISYKVLSRYRGQWIANGTKPIYINKTDDENIESILFQTQRLINAAEKKKPQKGLDRNTVLMSVSFASGIAIMFFPISERYDFLGLLPFFIGAYFSLKVIRDKATWN